MKWLQWRAWIYWTTMINECFRYYEWCEVSLVIFSWRQHMWPFTWLHWYDSPIFVTTKGIILYWWLQTLSPNGNPVHHGAHFAHIWHSSDSLQTKARQLWRRKYKNFQSHTTFQDSQLVSLSQWISQVKQDSNHAYQKEYWRSSRRCHEVLLEACGSTKYQGMVL
jgi:hypothetical protein